jgi:DNA adenine methylase
MVYFWQKSARCEFLAADFVSTMQATVAGDVVYCDPPYVPLSATASFTSYSADGFGLASQRTLAHEAEHLVRRGIPVVVSNHDLPFTQEIYAAADEMVFFDVQRHISCDGDNRVRAAELLAVYRVRQHAAG